MTSILLALAALLTGGVIGFLVAHNRATALSARNELLQQELSAALAAKSSSEAKVVELSASLQQVSDESHRLSYENAKLTEQKAEQREAFESRLAAEEKHQQESMAELKSRFQETIDKVTAQLSVATEQMLKERQKEFAEASNTNLGQIVTPLRETIDRMKQAIDDNTAKQSSLSGEMKANLENMMRHSMAAKESADELTRVFKHGTKVQGDWGETVLDELLQAQGLTRGIHYDTQTSIRDSSGATVRSDSGSLLRPDVILHLDDRRELIIDSKVSLTAFIDYVNAESEGERQHFLKAHVESLQKHVRELSHKDYSSYIRPPKVKMDYVIMFVPHSGALLTALNSQPDLWRRAMERNVFIADEQTLFAALRIVSLTWTQILQAQNHEKVYALANEMLNRVGLFWKEYEQMGRALRKATEAYDNGARKITDGGQSINTTAYQLLKLGARQNDKNPLPEPHST